MNECVFDPVVWPANTADMVKESIVQISLRGVAGVVEAPFCFDNLIWGCPFLSRHIRSSSQTNPHEDEWAFDPLFRG